MSVLSKLDQLDVLLSIKHMPGKHSQKLHAGSRGGAPVSGMFPNSKRVMFNTPSAERRVGEVLEFLPMKARDLITTTSENVSFWTSDKSGTGSYTYSGGHRISFSDDLSALEEFGHAIDKELGLRKGRAAEYSRSRAWREVMQQEYGGIGTSPIKARAMGYTTGLATEDFAKTFVEYIDRPDVLAKRQPARYAHMESLFGE